MVVLQCPRQGRLDVSSYFALGGPTIAVVDLLKSAFKVVLVQGRQLSPLPPLYRLRAPMAPRARPGTHNVRGARGRRGTEWVVYAKRPFGGPQAVLAYLSRYTHRVAIANSRLIACDRSGVPFRWKDYRAEGRDRQKIMTLATAEFSSHPPRGAPYEAMGVPN
jgi:hypothetical protein